MKIKLAALIFILASTGTIMALIEFPFESWDNLKDKSPDIIIARCTRTPDLMEDHGMGPTGSVFFSDMEVILVLKGTTNWGGDVVKTTKLMTVKLNSDFYPYQGEYYLIFSAYDNGRYHAIEKYRVIPLCSGDWVGFALTNKLANKPLDKQLQILRKMRIDDLDRQMKEEQKEKQRLEEGLEK